MVDEQVTVSGIFLYAQALKREHPEISYREIKERIVSDFKDKPFPPLHNLTIPEQDSRAPEEDWTAGLPLVRRGIQFSDWDEIAQGIVISLEQTENYERERGPEGTRDTWHDRSMGIEEITAKSLSKWLPEELKRIQSNK